MKLESYKVVNLSIKEYRVTVGVDYSVYSPGSISVANLLSRGNDDSLEFSFEQIDILNVLNYRTGVEYPGELVTRWGSVLQAEIRDALEDLLPDLLSHSLDHDLY